MTKSEILYGLNDLMHNSETFLTGNTEYDSIFLKDIDVLRAAIQIVQKWEENDGTKS